MELKRAAKKVGLMEQMRVGYSVHGMAAKMVSQWAALKAGYWAAQTAGLRAVCLDLKMVDLMAVSLDLHSAALKVEWMAVTMARLRAAQKVELMVVH